jgi:hypothetical protein
MLHMHVFALEPLVFVIAALCLLILVSMRLLAVKAIRVLAFVVWKAIDGEYAALTGALRGKSAITKFADAETMDMGQASIAVQSRAEAATRNRFASEMTDGGLIDWRRTKVTSKSGLLYAT